MDRSQAGPFRLDWIFHLPLYRGLSEVELIRGEFDHARQNALRLCEIAGKPGQFTYLALGQRQLAAIALAEGNLPEAQAQIQLAMASLEGREASLAQWPVFSLAAGIAGRLGRVEAAEAHRRRSEASLEQLAGSMDPSEPLSRSLLDQLGRRERTRFNIFLTGS